MDPLSYQPSDSSPHRGLDDLVAEALTCLQEFRQMIHKGLATPTTIETLVDRVESAFRNMQIVRDDDRERLKPLRVALDAAVHEAQTWLENVGRPMLHNLAQHARAMKAYTPRSDSP